MSKFASIKVGELVTLVVPLKIKATGQPFQLDGLTTIKFRFRKQGSSVALEKTGAISGDASLGIVAYALLPGDWTGSPALSEGYWLVLVEASNESTIKRFGPSEGTLTLKIESALT